MRINKSVKEMWRLEKKRQSEVLTKEEKKYYASNIDVIITYYEDNVEYWKERKSLLINMGIAEK